MTEFGPRNIYRPAGGEMLWKYYLPQFRDDVIDTFSGIKARLNVSRILAGISGLGTVAAPVIIDSLSAHVEAAPHFQGSTVGGTGFTIESQSNGVLTRWQGGGSLESSYILYKLAASGVTGFPRGGSLPEISTQYMIPSIDIAPDTVACFVLVPYGPSGPLGNSDPLCTIRNIALGAAAGNLSISLNEGNLASFTWLPPAQGGHDGYRLIPLSGVPRLPVDLPATATGYTHDTLGAPTCYTLATMRAGAIIGYTNLLCGIPGKSRFPSALATLTPTPPGPVASTRTATATETPIIILPSPTTRTPTITPAITATPTAILGYYTQSRILLGGETLVKAGPAVDPRALQIVIDKAYDRTSYRPDIRNQCVQSKIEISIIPNGQSINTLPEIVFRSVNPSTTRGWTQGRLSAVAEENLLQLPTDRATQLGIDVFDWEFGHVLEWNCMSTAEVNEWTDNHYPRLASAPGFPNNWSDLTPFYGIYPSSEAETFSDIGRMFLKRLGNQIGAKDVGTRAYFENIYGPR